MAATSLVPKRLACDQARVKAGDLSVREQVLSDFGQGPSTRVTGKGVARLLLL